MRSEGYGSRPVCVSAALICDSRNSTTTTTNTPDEPVLHGIFYVWLYQEDNDSESFAHSV